MEIFIYPLCYLPAILALIFPPILPLIQFFIAKIILIVLWAKLIKHKEDDMRALWRFAAEWTLGTGYVIFSLIRSFCESGKLFYLSSYMPLPDSFLSKIWTFCNLPFSFAESGSGMTTPWLYIIVGISFIAMCLKRIRKYYKENGELW